MPPFFPSAKTGCLDGDNSENMSRKLSWFVPLRPLPLPFPSFPFPLDLPSFPLPSFPLPDQGSHAMGTKWTSNSSNSSKTPHLCHLYPFHLAIFRKFFKFHSLSSTKCQATRHTPRTEVSTFASLVDIDFPPLVVGLIELQGFFHGLKDSENITASKKSENGL